MAIDDIWSQLTVGSAPRIGFYTFARRESIPHLPGVYAWFLPLLMPADLRNLLEFMRRTFAYDPNTNGIGVWESKEAGFRWDPLTVSVKRSAAISLSDAQDLQWQTIRASANYRRFCEALYAATIFSRPLYVGLTNDLSRRYNEHITGKSDLKERFEQYVQHADMVKLIGSKKDVEQLLFVCVPLHPTSSAGEDPLATEGNEVKLLEHILKQICQPVFGAK